MLSIAKIDGPITPSFKDAFKTVVTEWEADFEEVANQGPLFYFKTNFKAGRDKVVTYNFEKPEEVRCADRFIPHFKAKSLIGVGTFRASKISFQRAKPSWLAPLSEVATSCCCSTRKTVGVGSGTPEHELF